MTAINTIEPSLPEVTPQVAGHIIIVGAGQAGLGVAEALRAGGYAGRVTLLGDEADGPYHRPPLSKAWLSGEAQAAQLVMRAPEAIARKNIELRCGVKVLAIDRGSRTVTLEGGEVIEYTGLALATGARSRTLPLPGAQAAGVLALRTKGDASAVAAALDACAARALPLVVIGGGFIGLEVAATARKRGVAVTLLEALPRLLARAVTSELSDWYARLHRDQGVHLVLQAQVAGIEVSGGVASAVLMGDGTRVPAGAVLMGVGAVANDELARAAGLECDRGIVVDACSRTSDPLIVAAGDCTAVRQADGSLRRLESVQNALEQGRSAAAAFLGQQRPFIATPWFWSDQYDRKLQMAGLSADADRTVLRGDMADASFSLWHFIGDRLVAVDAVNASRDHLLSRKLLDAGKWPTPAQVADTGFDLNTLV